MSTNDNVADVEEKITYHYIHAGEGRITVAYLPDNERDSKIRRFHYGISYCNLKDPFVKKTGRDKAMGRVLQELAKPTNDRSYSGLAEFEMVKGLGFYKQINEIVTQEALHNDEAPRWVKDWVKKQTKNPSKNGKVPISEHCM